MRAGRLAAAVLALTCLVLALSPVLPAQPATPELYVYASTNLRSRLLRRRMQAAMPGLRVAVFGHVRDFRAAVAMHRPAAALARRPLLEDLGLAVHLQGMMRGQADEPFALVSRTPALRLRDVPHSTIGMRDLLPPHAMEDLAQRLLSGQRPRALRRVANPEDLMAMLRLDLAQGIVLPQRLVPGARLGSEMPVSVTNLPDARVGLHAVHLADPTELNAYLAIFTNLDATLNFTLGVDEWR